jgi:hypothetical protein
MHGLATILRGPRKERGRLRVNAIAFIPGMTVIVWRRLYQILLLALGINIDRVDDATSVHDKAASEARMSSANLARRIVPLPHLAARASCRFARRVDLSRRPAIDGLVEAALLIPAVPPR